MGVDGILLEAHRVQLRQELVGEPGLAEHPQPRRRVVDQQQALQLVADPLDADDLETVGHGRDRRGELGRRGERERRDEAGRAQHPQGVVGEGRLGRLRRAQPLGRQVLGPAVRIDEHRLGERERHRVHREVASEQVVLDRVGVGHLGLPALGSVHVAPERRDLERHTVLLAADGAEPRALEPHVVGPAAHDRLDGVGSCVGRQIDVG